MQSLLDLATLVTVVGDNFHFYLNSPKRILYGMHTKEFHLVHLHIEKSIIKQKAVVHKIKH